MNNMSQEDKRMTLAQLKVFVSVAETLSFARAAKREGIAQPSVTDGLQLLERNVGTPLIDRLRGSPFVSLTPAGREMLPRAKAILAAVADARSSMAKFKPSRWASASSN